MENPFALLGGSLVADEHNGDYAQAARLVTEETETGLLAKGILEVLAGAPGAARDTFDRLRELDGRRPAGTDRLDEAASGYEQAIDALESRRFGASRDS